jgi:lipoprotein NlpI
MIILLATFVLLQAPPRMSEAERQRNYDNFERCVNVKAGADFAAAIVSCNELLARSVPLSAENRAMVYAKRGVLKSRLRMWAPAVDDLSTSLRPIESEHRTWVLTERGLALNELRRLSEARADFNAVLQAEPSGSDLYVRALIGRGVGAFLAKDYNGAIGDFNTLGATKPLNATILYLRGMSRRALGDSAGGAADIAAAIRLEPDIEVKMKSYGVIKER